MKVTLQSGWTERDTDPTSGKPKRLFMETEPNVLVLSPIDGYVQSRTRKGLVHLVWFSKGHWTCGCEDWIFRSPKHENFECYHIIRFKDEVAKHEEGG